jgi:hypothetical protein
VGEGGQLTFEVKAVVITCVGDLLTTTQNKIKQDKRLKENQIGAWNNAGKEVALSVGMCPFYLSGEPNLGVGR